MTGEGFEHKMSVYAIAAYNFMQRCFQSRNIDKCYILIYRLTLGTPSEKGIAVLSGERLHEVGELLVQLIDDVVGLENSQEFLERQYKQLFMNLDPNLKQLLKKYHSFPGGTLE